MTDTEQPGTSLKNSGRKASVPKHKPEQSPQFAQGLAASIMASIKADLGDATGHGQDDKRTTDAPKASRKPGRPRKQQNPPPEGHSLIVSHEPRAGARGAKRGRPATYSDDDKASWQSRICAWLATGKSLASFCTQEGTPGLVVIVDWRRESPSFASDYTRAREDGADAFADELIDIADGAAAFRDAAQVNAARLRVDTRKWVASKLKPRIYGERIEQVMTDPDGRALGTALTEVTDRQRADALTRIMARNAITDASPQQLAALFKDGQDALGPMIDVTPTASAATPASAPLSAEAKVPDR